MTNEEKSKALVDELGIIYTDCERATIKELLMEMAEWKDKQFTQEKEKFIDNVCEWLRNNIDDYMMTGEGEFLDSFDEMDWLDDMFGDLKKEMKNEI